MILFCSLVVRHECKLLAYADVNLLGENIQIKKTEALLHGSSKEGGLEVQRQLRIYSGKIQGGKKINIQTFFNCK
jgi:hypothetical protein